MKYLLLYVLCIGAIFCINKAHTQNIDTLVDVGGYKLHFNIIKGKGTPILFEAGGGEDATTWKNLVTSIENITKTTLITYDRAGFGKSTFDTAKHGILNGIAGLETGLAKLGFDGHIILVAHSQGGLYATLYASRHPDKVTAAVLIDATTACFYNPARLGITQRYIDKANGALKYTRPGLYFQGADFSSNIEVVRNSLFPVSVPVIDFVSDRPPFADSTDIADWKWCHKEFAAAEVNRTGITAWGCGHFIFEDNPSLIITAIAITYAGIAGKDAAKHVNERIVNYNLQAANEAKKLETSNRHSLDDIDSWGQEMLRIGDVKKAVEVYKLNIFLHPSSWKVYDSYANALMQNREKTEAAKMYRKSVELNPGNEHARKALREIVPD